MRRLSGLDASFLYLETPSTPMHTMGVLLLEEREPPLSLESIESLLLERLHHLPSLGQRVIDVPLGLDHPVLVDDPHFDIRNHVVRVHWDEPGTLEDLDWAVGLLAGRPLDRTRPLWQLWWFDHLEGGADALVFKLHHSIIDGVSSAVFMAQLLDTEPAPPAAEARLRENPVDELPNASTLTVQALIHQGEKAGNAVRSAIGMAREIRNQWSLESTEASTDGTFETQTRLPHPREPFNGSLSTHRTISRASASLEDFRYVKKAFDTTINDVLLAACTVALRGYLGVKAGTWLRPLTAAVPVSTRQVEHEPGGNHVSSLFVRLPVYLTRPEDIIRTVRQNTLAAKQAHSDIRTRFLETVLEVAPPPAVTWLARQHERLRLSDWYPPPCNLIVSNLAGPPIPLYFAGAQVRAAYPFGPLVSGSGLNLTVMSYRGRMNLGLIACPRLMPAADRFVADVASAVTTLCDAADRAGNR